MSTSTLLSTAYLPPVEYFAFLMDGEVWIENQENYSKQSYRNRTRILTGNGVQTLSIPVVHETHKPPISEVRIEYTTPWQRNHWRAIETAYNASPYYLYYKDILQPFFQQRFEFLFDFNLKLLYALMKALHIETDIRLTTEHKTATTPDLRMLIHPKQCTLPQYPFKLAESYYQVFDDRFGFTPNLSIIDLLFNAGPQTCQYLEALNLQFKSSMTSDGK